VVDDEDEHMLPGRAAEQPRPKGPGMLDLEGLSTVRQHPGMQSRIVEPSGVELGEVQRGGGPDPLRGAGGALREAGAQHRVAVTQQVQTLVQDGGIDRGTDAKGRDHVVGVAAGGDLPQVPERALTGG
jgi:hypothetical protein